jgi:transposase
MAKPTRYVGLDVHAETIAVAIAEENQEVRSLGTIPNTEDAVRKLVKKLGDLVTLRFCYEAGPCGFVLYWLLVQLGVECVVIAPSLVPARAGDRIKTDRRDAEKLARLHRSGDLTPVWIPDKQHEAVRDLVRAREAAKKDQTRVRHRLSKFFLRQGHRKPEGTGSCGTAKYMAWAKSLKFEHQAHETLVAELIRDVELQGERVKRLDEAIDAAIPTLPEETRAVVEALQAMRGVAQLNAVTVVTEAGDLLRFKHPSEVMGYSGVVPREHSSGASVRRGGITKTGNAHLRRVIVESAWHYIRRPRIGRELAIRHKTQSAEVKAIAWKAQHRLYNRFHKLAGKGKPRQQAVTAVARELLGFMWAIAHQVKQERERKPLPSVCKASPTSQQSATKEMARKPPPSVSKASSTSQQSATKEMARKRTVAA